MTARASQVSGPGTSNGWDQKAVLESSTRPWATPHSPRTTRAPCCRSTAWRSRTNRGKKQTGGPTSDAYVSASPSVDASRSGEASGEGRWLTERGKLPTEFSRQLADVPVAVNVDEVPRAFVVDEHGASGNASLQPGLARC